jgi:thiamine-phosphate pyrophosphorylase
LINSRTDVALAVQADGVHLRSSDISPQEVRMLWMKCMPEERGRQRLAQTDSPHLPLIGVSCHSPAEVVKAADDNATFAVFGPVFEKAAEQRAGMETFRKACQSNIPVLALGGVTLANAHTCLAAGAAGVAAIRLFQENDVATVVKQLRG